jgi:hypothetical protein
MSDLMRGIKRVFVAAAFAASAGNATTAGREQAADGLVFGLNKTRLWKTLHNPEQRDALFEPVTDLPVFKDNAAGVSLFFTRTGRLHYSVEDFFDLKLVKNIAFKALESKFALETDLDPEDDEEAFDAFTTGRADTISGRIRKAIGLMTFQEHRVGATLTKQWQWGQWDAELKTWCGLAERNYWLDSDFRDGLAAQMQQVTPQNDGEFNLSDFMTTCWGIGDLHGSLGYRIPTGKHFTCRLGAKAIIPTATKARRNTAHALAPLSSVFDLLQFARTRLNEALIEPSLGMGHFGVGVWTDNALHHQFAENRELTLSLRAGLDYLLPKEEERMLMREESDWGNDPIALATEFGAGSDTRFRSYIHQYALPEPVPVVVAPGCIGTLGLSAQFRLNAYQILAGYDCYIRQQERLVRFVEPKDEAAFDPVQQKTEVALQRQQVVYAGLSHTSSITNVSLAGMQCDRLDIVLGLKGSVALVSEGLGDTFGLGITARFAC